MTGGCSMPVLSCRRGGDDLQGTAALRAFFDIDLEHSFERPAHVGRRLAEGARRRGPLRRY